MKKFEFTDQIRKIQKDRLNTKWEKAILGALFLSLVIFIAATSYLYFRPIPSEIVNAVDQEVNNQAVNFNFKTLEKLENRQVPAANTQTPSGKNPFTPF